MACGQNVMRCCRSAWEWPGWQNDAEGIGIAKRVSTVMVNHLTLARAN